MEIQKDHDGRRYIPIQNFDKCLLDGISKAEIIKLFPTREGGAYYLDKFANYLKTYHQISLVEYLKKYLAEYPKCLQSGEDVGFSVSGKGVEFSNYKNGKGVNKACSEKFRQHCELMSQKRRGDGNPMFGKVAWNKNNAEWAEYMRQKHLGKKLSEETKLKLSEAAKKRKIHGHAGKKHSEEAKAIMREKTAARYRNGTFKRETSIHVKVREFLSKLDLVSAPEEEFTLKYFSLDFAFPDKKLAIECQGTYFHIDPRFYPNGPVSKVQRRNFGRDVAKKKYLDRMGWTMLELWETEINNEQFKEILTCKLQELNLLSHSESKKPLT
jgi:very-short-patch-repair endonuclease